MLFAACIAGVAVLTTPRDAGAQSEDRVQKAEALFREGRDAMRRNAYLEACRKFRESDALDPSPGTRLNWALCSERLGHLAEALRHARWALDRMRSEDDRRPIAERTAVDLERRVSHLTVRRPPGRTDDDTVYVDGEPLAIIDGEETLAIDPGLHVILFERPAREPTRELVTLHEGESVVRDLPAGPSPQPTEERSARRSPPGRTGAVRRTIGYVLAGGAGAALATTAVMTVLALDAKRTVDAQCPGGSCTLQGWEAADRGRAFVHVGSVALAGALAGAAASAVLLWPHQPAVAYVGPVPAGAAVSFVGRF